MYTKCRICSKEGVSDGRTCLSCKKAAFEKKSPFYSAESNEYLFSHGPHTPTTQISDVYRKQGKQKVRLVFISDTHANEGKFTPALNEVCKDSDINILCHCGDWTKFGSPNDHKSFIGWLSGFKRTQFKYIFLVSGNHEIACGDHSLFSHSKLYQDFKNIGDHVFYLKNNTLVLTELGYLVISGMSFWGGQSADKHKRPSISYFPARTASTQRIKCHVLISHLPPKGIMDDGRGSKKHLAIMKESLKPLLYVFGHSHMQSSPSQDVMQKINNTLCVNTSCRVSFLDFYF